MSETLFQTVNIKNQDIVWLNIPKGLVYFKNKAIGDGVGNNGELFQGYIGYGTKNQKNCVVKKFPIPQDYAYLSEENIELILGKKLAHKNIVEFYECNKSQYNYYLFMEFCSGGSLQQLINIPGQEDNYFYNKPLEEKQALDIMSQILDALLYMKNFQINDAKGCFHRDIKPDNIMFDAQGKAKLIDFGMGKFKATRETNTSFKGSPIYMSPQNLTDQQYDLEKNDVWSVGIILYQLLEGQFPWRKELESLEDLKEAQKLLKNSDNLKFDNASPSLQKLIKFMLKYNEKDRATFDDVKNSEPFTTYFNQDTDQTNKIHILLSNYDYYKSLQTLLQFQNFDKLVLDLILLEINKLKNNIIKNSNLEVRVLNLYNDRIFQKRKNYSFKRPQYLKDKLQRKLTNLIQTIIINDESFSIKDLRDFCSIIIKLYNPQFELQQKIESLEQLLKFARQ